MIQIGFQNFRRFELFPTLDINNLTFLVGSNNAGKSTMVKALLLVYDNLRSLRSYMKDDKWDTPNFRFDANKTHDLHVGTFWRALNTEARRRGENLITFTIAIDQLTYEIVVTCNKNKRDDKYETVSPINRITLRDARHQAEIIVDYLGKHISITLDADGEQPQQMDEQLDNVTSFAYSNDLVNRIFAASTVWQGHSETLKEIARDVLDSLSNNYMEYFYAHGVTQRVVYSYEDKNDYIATILHDYENEKMHFKGRERTFVAEWMQHFGIDKKPYIRSVSGAAYSVLIVDKDFDENASDKEPEGIELTDMGVGYIQLILLLMKLATFISRSRRKKNKSTLIIIEEPEQNLHPRLQSMLTTLFYNISEEFHIRFLIETHSEYIIRSAQLLAASVGEDGGHNPLSVYYFPDDETPYDMGLTPQGNFTRDFGEGFFDEADNLFTRLLTNNNSL